MRVGDEGNITFINLKLKWLIIMTLLGKDGPILQSPS